MTASAIGFTIVPRHVLGGKNYIAPSDKITLAYMGIGTQGIREILPLLANAQFRVVAVCDPNKDAVGYKDWDEDVFRDEVRRPLKTGLESGGDNTVPGGRENGKSIVDNFYTNVIPNWDMEVAIRMLMSVSFWKKKKTVDAVKIMTPDHLHGVFSMAAMKKGKHVMVHKPLSNRLLEGKKVIQMAREQ